MMAGRIRHLHSLLSAAIIAVLAAVATDVHAADTPLAAFDGSWRIDWSASEGMVELMHARGAPRPLVSLVQGADLQQRVTSGPSRLGIEVDFPVGSMQEVLTTDQVPQAHKSRLGRHTSVSRIDDTGAVVTTRTFEAYRMVETRRVTGDTLVVTMEVFRKDGVHATGRQTWGRVGDP